MKKRTLLFCALWTFFAAQAQTPPSATPQATVNASKAALPSDASTLDELSNRLDALEKKATTWDKIRDRLPRIDGYIQLRYQWNDADKSSFDIRRARFGLKGDLGPKLDYRFQAEFASKVQIVDAFVQYKPLRQLNVKAGQYKIPFSIENTEYAPLKFEFIDYPMALRKLMGLSEAIGGETLSATGRDIGLTLYGGFGNRGDRDLVSYDFGVFNGSGINRTDNNRSKDIVGRLIVRPAAGWMISGSYYWGEYGKAYLKRQRHAVGVCYDRGPVVVRSEWVGGTTGIAATSDTPANDLHSDGWYAMLGWRATHSLMPAIRYESFYADSDRRSSARRTNYTAGIVWQPLKQLRLQANYTYEDHAAPNTANKHVVSVMLTGIFN